MTNQKGLFVKLSVDKVMRAAFRAARARDGLSMKALAEAAGVRESLLLRYEHGQYLVRVDELEGLNNAHKLLKMEPPEASEPFEYSGNGALPGTPIKRKKGKQPKDEVVVYERPVKTEKKPAAMGAESAMSSMKTVLELEERGILSRDAAMLAVYALVQELTKEIA